jgi:hypothetical protein
MAETFERHERWTVDALRDALAPLAGESTARS